MKASDSTPAVVFTNGTAFKFFCLTAGLVLTVTGLAKIWGAFGGTQALLIRDPFLGISFQKLFFAAGLLEIAVAGVCFFNRNKKLGTMLVAWLASNLLLYRLGLWYMGWHRPCGCVGSLSAGLHISEHTVDILIKLLLAYLLVGSHGLLLFQRLRRRSPELVPTTETALTA